MTVQEAAPLWDDPRSVDLKRWGETFAVRLDEFHYGHVAKYERERLSERASYPEVWTEVKALRALLQYVVSQPVPEPTPTSADGCGTVGATSIITAGGPRCPLWQI